MKVTDTEALAYYTQNPDQYTTTAPSRDVRHILIGEQVDPSCVPSQAKTCEIDYAKSKAEADRIYAELKGGADFAALAKKYSDDPGSKDTGGKYNAVKGQSVPEFDKVAFELEDERDLEARHDPVRLPRDPGARRRHARRCHSLREGQGRGSSVTLLQQKRNDVIAKWVEDLQKRYKGKVSYAAGFAPPELPDTTTETQ